ncbi:Zn(2)-C6 fungal-type DNA-binding domain [Cordyceps militaris]|uniref:Zn(2)-C6 fungal-type DNA-binding domain n=1 Tax=Cordyceps militaris TaxID=73501 RepID=A0A2H4S5I3_CORMI|nr:Zn(2)-C6 fungal-type DNA-binding domain [Cordyceps militaris]
MSFTKPAAPGDVPKHRACDECRSRKLACSKEADGCARCKRERIPCYYSPQKPMGRPRKRRPADEEPAAVHRRAASPKAGLPPRSRSASSSAPSTGGAEMPPFPLRGTTPSFGDAADLSFLDHQASSTPDMALFDLLPSYDHDGFFHGTLPMAHDSMCAYQDLSFLDPAFASAPPPPHNDGPHHAFGATPELSVGSHTPFHSEPSFSPPPPPPPHHTRCSTQPRTEGYTGGAPAVLQPIPSVSCPCLSSLYMALESLANLPRSIAAAMRVARHASRVAQGVLACKVCSCDLLDVAKPPPMQAFQNMMLLATLVPSACNAYTAIIELIDRDCGLAVQQGRCIHFSMRDMAGGGLWDDQQAAAFAHVDDTELGPHEWRRCMLAVIRLDVYGTTERRGRAGYWSGNGPPQAAMGLSEVVAALDERSQKRHALVDASAAAGTLPPHTHYMMTPRSCKPEDRNCVRVLEVARLALNSLVIA